MPVKEELLNGNMMLSFIKPARKYTRNDPERSKAERPLGSQPTVPKRRRKERGRWAALGRGFSTS